MCNELLRDRLWQSHLLFAKRTSCGEDRSSLQLLPSRPLEFRPSERQFLFFLVTLVCGRSIFHLAPVYHSKRSYLPETRRPTSVGVRVMRYRLVEKRFVLPNGTSTVLRFGVITLDFKRFNSICRINLEGRLKCEITHIKNRCFFNNAFILNPSLADTFLFLRLMHIYLHRMCSALIF